MKTITFICSFVFLGCGPVDDPEPTDPSDTADCESDYDCKGDRVCESGRCVDPDDSTGSGDQEPSYPCGTVNIGCNCSYTSAYDGQVTAAPICESGYHQFQMCQGFCNGGYPWRTVCTCN